MSRMLTASIARRSALSRHMVRIEKRPAEVRARRMANVRVGSECERYVSSATRMAEKRSAGRLVLKRLIIAEGSMRPTHAAHSSGLPRSERHPRSMSASELGRAKLSAVGAAVGTARARPAAAADPPPAVGRRPPALTLSPPAADFSVAVPPSTSPAPSATSAESVEEADAVEVAAEEAAEEVGLRSPFGRPEGGSSARARTKASSSLSGSCSTSSTATLTRGAFGLGVASVLKRRHSDINARAAELRGSTSRARSRSSRALSYLAPAWRACARRSSALTWAGSMSSAASQSSSASAYAWSFSKPSARLA
mmetsp:Transcript_8574/g.17395  ORF Transcript_8574/g.17395 Transcript_8574/m.17395 type:complete len:310 (-) Transcript_8574:645-1574(-)